jgi:hypothetical protein
MRDSRGLMDTETTDIFISSIPSLSLEEPQAITIPKCARMKASEFGGYTTESFVVVMGSSYVTPEADLARPCYVIPVSSEIASVAFQLSSTKRLESIFQEIITHSGPNQTNG